MTFVEHYMLIAVRRNTGVCLLGSLMTHRQAGARILSSRQRFEHEDLPLVTWPDRSDIIAVCEDIVSMLTEIQSCTEPSRITVS